MVEIIKEGKVLKKTLVLKPFAILEDFLIDLNLNLTMLRSLNFLKRIKQQESGPDMKL